MRLRDTYDVPAFDVEEANLPAAHDVAEAFQQGEYLLSC